MICKYPGAFFRLIFSSPIMKTEKSLKRNNKKVVLYTSMLKWLLNPSYLSMIKIKQILNVKHSSTEFLSHLQRIVTTYETLVVLKGPKVS